MPDFSHDTLPAYDPPLRVLTPTWPAAQSLLSTRLATPPRYQSLLSSPFRSCATCVADGGPASGKRSWGDAVLAWSYGAGTWCLLPHLACLMDLPGSVEDFASLFANQLTVPG